jgi:4'-phosphopantetheinyl transferase
MLVEWHERNETDVPTDDSWLSPWELATLARMRFAKRRSDWRLGRWTAKWAVASMLGLPDTREAMRELEIRPTPSGVPEVFSANRSTAVTISLSHRCGLAVCAVARTCHSRLALGCDLEQIEPHSDLFLADYFTIEEQSMVREAPDDRWRLLALLWSAKESLLKALHLGLRVDTRSVNVTLESPHVDDPSKWYGLRVHYPESGTLGGWWRTSGGFVRTLVANST